MATTKKTTASDRPRAPRLPRLRTNVVVGEDVAGNHHCVYAGVSADLALRCYAQLRENGGRWRTPAGGTDVQFTRAALILDPRTSKHCSFNP